MSFKAQPPQPASASTASLRRAETNWRRKMTTISSGAEQPSISNPLSGLVRWFGRGAYALDAYCERRAAIRALLQRDDRELRDIGLVRSQIELAVHRGHSADMRRAR
jgi:uncharacterized protein YjiS (DUF1127 family)